MIWELLLCRPSCSWHFQQISCISHARRAESQFVQKPPLHQDPFLSPSPTQGSVPSPGFYRASASPTGISWQTTKLWQASECSVGDGWSNGSFGDTDLLCLSITLEESLPLSSLFHWQLLNKESALPKPFAPCHGKQSLAAEPILFFFPAATEAKRETHSE